MTLVVAMCALHVLLTGPLLPRRIVERLNNPVQVKQITSIGFITADGRLIKMDHVKEVPTNSVVVREAVSRGIELSEDGRTFGLLKIWHWCGNDPVRYHIGRVDLSALILAAGGKPDPDIPQEVLDRLFHPARALDYGEHGLNVSDYGSIRRMAAMPELTPAHSRPRNASKPAVEKRR